MEREGKKDGVERVTKRAEGREKKRESNCEGKGGREKEGELLGIKRKGERRNKGKRGEGSQGRREKKAEKR